tara:strand:- start:49 stop:780 length:732 start_codon:yes stop_codon:yes gene_type:complete
VKKKPNILIVIPARYNSSRFPGKPLMKINGVPMIQRTYNQALKNQYTKDVIVATDSKKIKSFCDSNKIEVIMTENCNSGTDRVAAVSNLMTNFDCYVNLQGDEPVINPKYINRCIETYIKYYPEYSVITGYGELNKDEALLPQNVKVVLNKKEEALCFSRSLIPNNSKKFFNHIGIYCFSKIILDKFVNTDRTVNELSEKVEMIRMLDMGIKIKMFKMKKTYAVDIPSDIENVERFLNEKKIN